MISKLAILVIISLVCIILFFVIISFFYLGMFNPTTFSGQTVNGFYVLGPPIDWDLNHNGILRIDLANKKMQKTLTVYTITAIMNGTSTEYNPTNLVLEPNVSRSVTFAIIPQMTTGSKYWITIEILYNAGGLNHTDIGTVTGVVS